MTLLKDRFILCRQCQREIGHYALEGGGVIGVGCIRRALARAGFQIGWALR